MRIWNLKTSICNSLAEFMKRSEAGKNYSYVQLHEYSTKLEEAIVQKRKIIAEQAEEIRRLNDTVRRYSFTKKKVTSLVRRLKGK